MGVFVSWDECRWGEGREEKPNLFENPLDPL